MFTLFLVTNMFTIIYITFFNLHLNNDKKNNNFNTYKYYKNYNILI
jgi:hypothetical protein